MRPWKRRKAVVPPDLSVYQYRGYELRPPFYNVDNTSWAAYTGGNVNPPWFTAKTRAELHKQIDEALASVPPPVC